MIKGQTEMFEYVIGIFFIVLILIFVIFMLGSYQTGQIELERQKMEDLRTMASMKRFLSSPLFSKDDSILDDTKLFVAFGMCSEMEEVFGKGWFARITILDGQPITPCPESVYSKECNYWVFCEENIEENKRAYDVPVNVYRKMFKVSNRGTTPLTVPALVEVGYV